VIRVSFPLRYFYPIDSYGEISMFRKGNTVLNECCSLIWVCEQLWGGFKPGARKVN
jgi:hypothetical protein